MKKIQQTDDLFVAKLQLLYDVETFITKSLPKMVRQASSDQLKAVLTTHQQETLMQCERLDKIFESLAVRSKKIRSETIRAIELDGKNTLAMIEDDALADVAIIGTARQVEHYETALYLTAMADAEMLGLTVIAGLLEETLQQEEATDEILATLAENLAAMPEVAPE
jgi:ferritin-like metal-binding protein YciE